MGYFADFPVGNGGGLIDIDVGQIRNGESVVFTLYYGAAPSEAAALAAVNAVGAQVYNLGQSGAPGGAASGSPVTGIMAVDGNTLP